MEIKMLDRPLFLAFLFVVGIIWIAVTVVIMHP